MKLGVAIVGAAALLAAGGAGARDGATPGATAAAIAIGSSGPLTGPDSADGDVLRGAAAYLDYVNSRGGVNGRKIVLTALDDAGDPTVAAENARRLIDQQHVLALFSVVGTTANEAVREVTRAGPVPQLFAASPATSLSGDYQTYPWVIGYPLPYTEEGAIYGRRIRATDAVAARIAVLYEADEDGESLLAGLRRGLGADAATLIAGSASYEPGATAVDSQIADLQATGANTLCIFAFGAPARAAFRAVAKRGWRPLIYVDQTAAQPSTLRLGGAAAEGAVSTLWAKDPATARYARDPAVQLATQLVSQFVPELQHPNALVLQGMAAAYSLIDVLKHAGRSPTRGSVLAAARVLNEASNPFVVPGVHAGTGPTAHFPITQGLLERWTRGRWTPFGGLQSATP